MKEELKTLKDIDDYGMEVCRTFKRELRQEAIKDIKAILTMHKTFHDLMYESLTGNHLTYSEEGKQAIINYIKWKNNITEEELAGEGK